MTKTTNVLRCTLTPTFDSEFTSEPADLELYMLCSNKIAVAARKLELADVAALLNDDLKFERFLSDYCKLEARIVKAFKRKMASSRNRVGNF